MNESSGKEVKTNVKWMAEASGRLLALVHDQRLGAFLFLL